MTIYQVTVRYGHPGKRYFVDQIEAPDLREALDLIARRLGDEVVAEADLLELRPAPDHEAERPFMSEGAPAGPANGTPGGSSP